MEFIMDSEESKSGFSKTIAKGIAQHHTSRMKERVEDSTVDFRLEAGERIEGLAQQIRQLGKRFESTDEAHRVARRLETVADYLRFRPSVEIATDAWEALRRRRALWVAGGALAAILLYRIQKRYRT